MEYYSAIKKNEILSSPRTLIDLEVIVLSGISQTEKDKYHDFTFTWNLENRIDIWTKEKQAHKYREHFDGC